MELQQDTADDDNLGYQQMETEEVEDLSSGSIQNIPDEVLEYIFKLISPYQDFRSCASVCKRWRNICMLACRSKLLAFHNQITEGELLWQTVMTEESPDNVSRRHSHCGVYSDKHLSMFIFGGCTASSSTFNDLLQFDLSNRKWIRPRAIGSYPSPKALATLVTNEDVLLLFGGWTHPSAYPLHQTWKLFSELHIYNIAESRWTQIKCEESDAWPPKTAGHSATLHGDKMVVFGGLTMQRASDNLSFQCSNNLWIFSLTSLNWYLQPTAGDVTPSGRYGQSQIYLDCEHLLILGGWLGSSNTDLIDIWMLDMSQSEWRWYEMKVEGVEHRPKDISRHPAARAAKDRVVVLAKSKIGSKKPQNWKGRPTLQVRNAIGTVPSTSRHHQPAASSSSEENDHVEPRRSVRPPSSSIQSSAAIAGPSHQPQPGPSYHAEEGRVDRELHTLGAPKPVKQRMMENRQRQLASLNRMEERLRSSGVGQLPPNSRSAAGGHNSTASQPQPHNSPAVCPNHRMMMNILDTSRAISENTVKWLPPNPRLPGVDVPQEVDLYSLVQGRTELILFGGLKRDISIRGAPPNHSTRDSSSVTNNIHILYPYIDRI